MKLRRVILLGILSSLSVAAAQVPQVALATPDATLSEAFSRIVAIRELLDGRVLIADKREARIVVGDFVRDEVRQLGRVGFGPGEYPTIAPLIPLAGDSTLMVDITSRRWLLMRGPEILSLVSSSHPAFAATGGNVRGADTAGRFLSIVGQPLNAVPQSSAALDSVSLVIFSLRTKSTDTVGTMLALPAKIQTSGREPDGRPSSIRFEFPVLGVGEEVLMCRDGWIAVARLNPYRIDWRSPDGRWLAGAPLPFSAVTVNAAEREAVRRHFEAAGGRPGSPGDNAQWPTVLPPFESTPLMELPDGNVLLRRFPSAKAPETAYDVVDRQSRLVRRIVLPSSQRIVGFGRAHVYTVAADNDGVEHLRRHRWR